MIIRADVKKIEGPAVGVCVCAYVVCGAVYICDVCAHVCGAVCMCVVCVCVREMGRGLVLIWC